MKKKKELLTPYRGVCMQHGHEGCRLRIMVQFLRPPTARAERYILKRLEKRLALSSRAIAGTLKDAVQKARDRGL